MMIVSAAKQNERRKSAFLAVPFLAVMVAFLPLRSATGTYAGRRSYMG
jgi:hypothetical protein